MKISLVSPMYNEENVIDSSIKNLVSALKELKTPWELIMVNDGSRDNTLKIAKQTAKNYGNVKIVSYPVNKGRGAALKEGFANATGDIIVTTESDMSWGNDIIKKMVTTLFDNPNVDMVIASPHLKGGGYKKVPLSAVGNIVLGKAFGNDLTMLSGMTRAYRRKVIDTMNIESDGKEIHLEIASKALALGYKIKEVPAILSWENKKKDSGKKRRKSSFNAKKLIISHLIFSFNESPIILLGSLSAIFILLGFIIFAYLLYTYFAGDLNPVRPLMFLAIILLVVGVQTVLFSFLAYQNKDLKKQSLILQKNVLEMQRKNK